MVEGRMEALASGRPGLACGSTHAGPVTLGKTLDLSEPRLLEHKVVMI